MGRRMTPEQSQRRAMARREGALARAELRENSVPRESAVGPVSFPVKADDPATRAAIDAFMAKQRGRK